MKHIRPLVVCLLFAAVSYFMLMASCLSYEHRAEIAVAAEQVQEANLRRHVDALTSIGSRRAGDGAAGLATIEYLEEELRQWEVETERESFMLTPSARVTLQVDSTEEGSGGVVMERELLGVYFGNTIAQSRVAGGFVKDGERLHGIRIEPGESAPVEQFNLLATFRGTVRPERVLEISAHHDTVPGTVGADDNTSGVVVLLEVARLLKENPPDCTVRLCFFAAEELGLLGAREHVNRMKADGSISQVFGLINLDTVGYFTDEVDSQESPARIPLVVWPPSTGNFLAIVGGDGSADLAFLVEFCGETYAPELPLYTLARLGGYLPDARRSDHAPYWDEEIPAVFLTDTAEFRSDRYHRPEDNVESLNFFQLRNVAALTLTSALAASALEVEE